MKNVVATVHEDYLPFLEIATDKEIAQFIRAQICIARGEELPKLEGLSSALVEAHVALIGRLNESRLKKSEEGRLGGAPKGNQNARRNDINNQVPKTSNVNANREGKSPPEKVSQSTTTNVEIKTTTNKPNTNTITNTVKEVQKHMLGKPNEGESSQNEDNMTGFMVIENSIYKRVIEHLNLCCDTQFKDSTKSTRNLINARLDEGFTEEDFFEVINKKVLEWKNNPSMAKYLRPETLFGVKFDSYLNEPWSNGTQNTLNSTQLAALRVISQAETEGLNNGTEHRDFRKFLD